MKPRRDVEEIFEGYGNDLNNIPMTMNDVTFDPEIRKCLRHERKLWESSRGDDYLMRTPD